MKAKIVAIILLVLCCVGIGYDVAAEGLNKIYLPEIHNGQAPIPDPWWPKIGAQRTAAS